jgi:uncharacterized membrane protein
MVPHPIIVDFAVALLAVSVGFDLLASVVEERDLRVVAWWTLMIGTVATALSVVSGYAAAPVDASAVVTETIDFHRNLGIITLSCFGACSLWRVRDPGGFPERYRDAYWILTSIGLGTLIVTAYWGGILVFKFGVGLLPPS